VTVSLYLLAVYLFIGPDVARLGDDRFAVREWAEYRLARWGWLARPELDRAAALSTDPEVLYRVRALCRGMDRPLERVQWVAVLWGDWQAPGAWWTAERRMWLYRETIRRRIPMHWSGPDQWAVWAPWRLHPSWDAYFGKRKYDTATKCNAVARHLRTAVPLPLWCPYELPPEPTLVQP
jgi:hypothetical protein